MSRARVNNLSDYLSSVDISIVEIKDSIDLGQLTSQELDDLKNATDPFTQYYNETRGDARYVLVSTVGMADGIATLDSSGKITFEQIPEAALGGLEFQGNWNADTNTPTLSSGTGTRGYFYKVSVAGSTNLDGITDWKIGDWAIFDGAAWQKIDQTEVITTVNGYIGDVVLNTDDINEGSTNLYFTAQRASDAAPVQTVFGRAGNITSQNGDYTASQVTYDNVSSGLVATESQAAIDEVHQNFVDHEADPDPHPQYTTTTEAANAAPVQSVNTQTGDVVLDTDDINEGVTNLYYTDTRARNSISASGDLSYDNVNGVISFSETYSTAAELLSALLTVDGTTSGLDADVLDGQHGTYYLDFNNFTNVPDPTITLGGDLSGSVTLTDLGDGTLTATVLDDSHNHIISNVDGLQTALDGKEDVGTAAAAVDTHETTFNHLDYDELVEDDFREALLSESTLSLDFINNSYEVYEGISDGMTNKPFEQILTFTRDSVANGFGPVKLEEAAVDSKRLVYNPVSKKRKGLLIEEQRTNDLLHNRDLSQSSWTSDGTPTINQNETGIDGSANTAWTVTDDDTGVFEGKVQVITVSDNSNTHTVSFYLKKTTSASSFPGVGFLLSGGTALRYQVTVDTDAGTAVARDVSDSVSVGVEDSGDYWRVIVSGANNGTGNTSLTYQIYPAVNTDASGVWDATTTGSCVYDHGQVELNASFVTTPILTTSAQVTRSADNCSRTLGSEFNASEGTVFAYAFIATSPPPGGRYFAQIDDGTSDNRLIFRADNSFNFAIVINGVVAFDGDLGPSILGGERKVAVSYSSSEIILSVDGASQVFSGASLPDGLNNLIVGNGGTQLVNQNSGNYRDFRYIPRVLSATELEALTK